MIPPPPPPTHLTSALQSIINKIEIAVDDTAGQSAALSEVSINPPAFKLKLKKALERNFEYIIRFVNVNMYLQLQLTHQQQNTKAR